MPDLIFAAVVDRLRAFIILHLGWAIVSLDMSSQARGPLGSVETGCSADIDVKSLLFGI